MSSVPYRIRRSGRARHARIVVAPDGVEVVVPQRFPMRKVEPFVEEKRRWIERTLRKMRESELEVGRPELEDGGEVPYLGERLLLRVRIEPGRVRPHVKRRGPGLPAAAGGGAGAPPGAPQRWYRKQARPEIEPRPHAAASPGGTSHTRLQIRGEQT